MSNPQKVQNFLDLAAISTGGWDASLAFVMGAGVIITFIGYKIVTKRKQPLFETEFHMPKKTELDVPIFVGPALFGIGWGLAGFCPGPAFTAIGTGSTAAIIFGVAMVVGMVAARLIALRQLAKF
jgi:uncharacterized protein